MSIPKTNGHKARKPLKNYLAPNTPIQMVAQAAADLGETITWLYGREPDGPGAHVHRGRTGEYDQEAVAAHPETGVVEVYAAHDHGQASAFLAPDEAVDLARALLAAAEEVRP